MRSKDLNISYVINCYKMIFNARIRAQAGSLVITIPNEVVEVLSLKEGQIKEFEVKNENKNTN